MRHHRTAKSQIDLTEVLGRVGMRQTYDIAEPAIVTEDLECAQPVVGSLTFTNTGSVLLVGGRATTQVVLPCSRCLVYYEEPLALDIDEQFPLRTHATHRGSHPEVEVEEEDAGPGVERLFDGPLFNLTEVLRQAVTLAIPLAPLHTPECQGLCAGCGRNLNNEACTCERPASSLALGALGQLLGKHHGRAGE